MKHIEKITRSPNEAEHSLHSRMLEIGDLKKRLDDLDRTVEELTRAVADFAAKDAPAATFTATSNTGGQPPQEQESVQ